MMLMTIDVGNTNLVFGVFEQEKLVAKFRLSTETLRTADEIGLAMITFFWKFHLDPEAVDEVLVASVVPQLMYTVRHAFQKYMDRDILVVGQDVALPLVNHCEEPLGVDRAVTGLGALALYGSPLIVVDFGTATKVDAYDREGAYIGGAICPGITISMDALFAKAAKLPRVEIKKPRSAIGINTVEQMQAGAVYGFVGSVECIVANTRREMGLAHVPVAATGGLVSLIAEYTQCIEHVNQNLTLEGLRVVHQRHHAP